MDWFGRKPLICVWMLFRPRHPPAAGGARRRSVEEQRGGGLGPRLPLRPHRRQRRFGGKGPVLGRTHGDADQVPPGQQVGRPGPVCVTGESERAE